MHRKLNHRLARRALLGLALLWALAASAAASAVSTDAPLRSAPHTSPERDAIIARARDALRAAGIDPASLTVREVEPVTWPDSSLGCRRPGLQYLQVQTPGYRVEFDGPHGRSAVHVAEKRAVICRDLPIRHPAALAPLRNLDLMTQRAKQMLASALHAPQQQIRVLGLTPAVWPDSALGCASQPRGAPGRVSGYRIMLEHRGRPFIFHTDLRRVFACPAIAAE